MEAIIFSSPAGHSHAPFSLHSGLLRRPFSIYFCCFCRLRLQKQQKYTLCERRRREEDGEWECPAGIMDGGGLFRERRCAILHMHTKHVFSSGKRGKHGRG